MRSNPQMTRMRPGWHRCLGATSKATDTSQSGRRLAHHHLASDASRSRGRLAHHQAPVLQPASAEVEQECAFEAAGLQVIEDLSKFIAG